MTGRETSTAGASARDPRALGMAGAACSMLGVLVMVVIGALGDSVIALTLPGATHGLPPYSFDAHPSSYLVSFLGWAGILLAAVGLTLSLRALRAGWLPRVSRVVWAGIAGVAGFTLVAPMASADVLIYAAYGRMSSTGINPFTNSPADVMAYRHDPVIDATEQPWQDAKSVYGPVVTGLQWMASKIGGDSSHLTVWVLQLIAGVTLIVAGLIVLAMAGRDPATRARVAILGIGNPLVIWAVMGGAHNEAVAVMLGLGAVLAMRRSMLLAGLLLGLAGCSKLSIGLVGVAMIWVLRREPRKLLTVAVTAAVTIGVLYAFVGGIEALAQARTQTSFMSTGTPHRALWNLLKLAMPQKVARTIIAILAWIALVLVASLLSQTMPKSLIPAQRADDPVPAAMRMIVIYSIAWLLTSMYTLPWYDLTAWLTLGCVVGSRVDQLMIIRTAMLSIGYIPGRDKRATPMEPAMEFIRARMRDTVCSAVLTGVLVALIVWARRRGAVWWPYGNPFRLPAAMQPAPVEGASADATPAEAASADSSVAQSRGGDTSLGK